jgi:DNA-binding CsgD family transcriptional regulator
VTTASRAARYWLAAARPLQDAPVEIAGSSSPDEGGRGFPSPSRLVGRRHEQAEIAQLLASARSGLSAALVLRGEAGVGKTALIDDAVAGAADLEILRLVGIESEMQLGFAGLHQLLVPFLDGIEALPRPQMHALNAAFGISDDDAPETFLISLATLTLLSHAATRRALLIVVDDAQWWDQESAEVLGFVARRLYADRVGLLIAVRDPSDRRVPLDTLPSITIRPLSERASVELLASTVEAPIESSVRDRILADALGNPLALLELTGALSTDQLAGVAMLPEPLAVGAQLEARFLRQVRELPAQTQRFLLVAAAEPTGDPALVWRAGRDLGFDEGAILAAEAEHLIIPGPPMSFRHSLIRSAIYHGASAAERRQAHSALAAATDVETDPDRRAWHRAAATHAPDEDVAAELEGAANRARSHGGYATTAALLSRAAQLTPDPSRRGLRYFAAAESDFTAGSSPRAHANLQHALPDLDPSSLAHARRLEALIFFIDMDRADTLGRAKRVVPMLLDAAVALGPLDIHGARETLLDAIQMAVYFGTASPTTLEEVARTSQSLTLAGGVEPTSVDLLLDALAELYAEGYDNAVPVLQRALAAIRTDTQAREFPRRLALGCWPAFALSDDEAVRSVANECVALSRSRGAFQVLPEPLNYLGQWALRTGSLAAADEYFTEADAMRSLLDRTGPATAELLIVSAWRGRETDVRAAAPALAAVARQLGLGLVVDHAEYAVALLELGLGNYRAAALCLPNFTHDLALGAFRAVDAIEANVRGGDHETAVAALEWLSGRALATGSSIDLGLAARGRALLSDDADAEEHFREALAQLESSGARLHLARAQLLYGEWLRRRNRRRDARVQLVAALDTFESTGANAFADRTRLELLASGVKARKRVDETRSDLTPQEEQIARLAAGGATNPEIGARLFISSSTVDFHLRKVYRKLDIKSRRELARTSLADG